MRYTIYSAEGEPLKQTVSAQLTADHAQPGNVSFDSAPGVAFPWVAWHADVLGMIGVPFAAAAEAFAHARKPI